MNKQELEKLAERFIRATEFSLSTMAVPTENKAGDRTISGFNAARKAYYKKLDQGLVK